MSNLFSSIDQLEFALADQPEARARSVNPNLEDALLYFIGCSA